MKIKILISLAISLITTTISTALEDPVIYISANEKNTYSESNKYGLKLENISYTTGEDGTSNGAYYFNGETSCIQVNQNISPKSLEGFTIMLYVKHERKEKGHVSYLFSNHPNPKLSRSLGMYDYYDKPFYRVNAGNEITSTKVPENKWTFIALSYDKKKDEVLVYLNNKFNRYKTKQVNGLNYFLLGTLSKNATSTFFKGAMDEIRIYNQALPEKEIIQSYRFDYGKRYKQNTDNLEYFYSNKEEDADIKVRVGDIDNLGLGYQKGFDIFCAQTTQIHPWPFGVNLDSYAGTDKPMVSSSFKYPEEGEEIGKADGYTHYTKRPYNLPIPIVLEYPKPTVEIKNVILQIMADDFQSPQIKSSFQFHINGKRLNYVENIINAINQTGPVAKLFQIGILEEDLHLFKDGKVSILIDDPTTGAGDGYVIDFVSILINMHLEKSNMCLCEVKGKLTDDKNNPLGEALVSVNGIANGITDANGNYAIDQVPCGVMFVKGSKEKYSSTTVVTELHHNKEEEINISLEKLEEETVHFFQKEIEEKSYVNLYGIYFNANEYNPIDSSETTLLQLASFVKSSPNAKIEIIGHTDSNGDEKANLELSIKRANAILNWLKNHGINTTNVVAKGLGESQPIESNKTPQGRALNRRVELKVSSK